MLRASIIVPTLNEEKLVGRCLKSLSKQTIPRKDYEIIVVDGGSKDKTVRIAKKYADKVLEGNYKPLGAARQAGFEAAKGRIVAFTDGAGVLPENWVEEIIKAFDEEGVVCALGPIACLEDDVELPIRFAMKSWMLTAKLFALLNLGGVIGSNFAVDKKTFKKIGGFRKIQLGDTDAGFRLARVGKLKYLDNVPVKTSVRRFREWGVIKTLMMGLIVNFQVFFGLNPSVKWEKVG